MRISDWSSDVCASDLLVEAGMPCQTLVPGVEGGERRAVEIEAEPAVQDGAVGNVGDGHPVAAEIGPSGHARLQHPEQLRRLRHRGGDRGGIALFGRRAHEAVKNRTVGSEEHTSELQSLMRNSYAVFCLKKKKTKQE